MSSLKQIIKNNLLTEIFRNPNRPKNKEGKFEWAILILNDESSKILQSCFQTHELTRENIARFEFIHDEKRSHSDMHAIYFLAANDEKNTWSTSKEEAKVKWTTIDYTHYEN